LFWRDPKVFRGQGTLVVSDVIIEAFKRCKTHAMIVCDSAQAFAAGG
jgi:hypothetical protein